MTLKKFMLTIDVIKWIINIGHRNFIEVKDQN